MDLSKRVFYDWVVVEYARAQIPEPWVAYSDDGGRTFYHNHLKEETQWEHPLRNTFYALLGKCRPDPSVNQYYHDLFNNLKPTLKQPQGWLILNLMCSGRSDSDIVPDDVLDMSQYLGIDLRQEAEFGWIAKQALQVALPPGWEEVEDDGGQPFFYHKASNKSSRHHPMDNYFTALAKEERKKARGQKIHPRELLRKQWMPFMHADGETYYYNFKFERSIWFPIWEKQYTTATRVIQKHVRSWLRHRRRLHAAARRVQSVFRGHTVRAALREWHVHCAAICVQSHFRMKAAKRLLGRHKAARAIQNRYRRHRAMEYRAHAIRSAVRIQAVVRSRLAKKQFWMTQAMGILERGGPVSAALATIRKLPPFEVAQILATQTEERSGEVARELLPRELGKAIRHLRPRRASCLFRFMEEEKGARVLEELDAEQNTETIELIANLPQLVGKAKDRCARDVVASVSVPKGAKCLDEMRASRAQKLLQEIPYLRKSAEIIECMQNNSAVLEDMNPTLLVTILEQLDGRELAALIDGLWGNRCIQPLLANVSEGKLAEVLWHAERPAIDLVTAERAAAAVGHLALEQKSQIILGLEVPKACDILQFLEPLRCVEIVDTVAMRRRKRATQLLEHMRPEFRAALAGAAAGTFLGNYINNVSEDWALKLFVVSRVQFMFRRFLAARRATMASLMEEHRQASASMIQESWRGKKAHEAAVVEEERQRRLLGGAAVVIQKFWRGAFARAVYARYGAAKQAIEVERQRARGLEAQVFATARQPAPDPTFDIDLPGVNKIERHLAVVRSTNTRMASDISRREKGRKRTTIWLMTLWTLLQTPTSMWLRLPPSGSEGWLADETFQKSSEALNALLAALEPSPDILAAAYELLAASWDQMDVDEAHRTRFKLKESSRELEEALQLILKEIVDVQMARG